MLFGENDDDKLAGEAGDDEAVFPSVFWLSSESSLERDDGGVGGNPKPNGILIVKLLIKMLKVFVRFWKDAIYIPWDWASNRMFILGTTILCCVPFKMICWLFSRLWEAGDSCKVPFYTFHEINQFVSISFEFFCFLFFFTVVHLLYYCVQILNLYLCMPPHWPNSHSQIVQLFD